MPSSDRQRTLRVTWNPTCASAARASWRRPVYSALSADHILKKRADHLAAGLQLTRLIGNATLNQSGAHD
jgi:hypothetical protein